MIYSRRHAYVVCRFLCSVFLIVSCSLLLIQGTFAAQSQEPSLTIVIIQPRNVAAYQEAVKGFLASLRRHLTQRFNTVIYESPEMFYNTLKQNKQISSAHPPEIDLIVTVGTDATADVSSKIQDIPLVFSMVLDPKSILDQRNDIVGASLNISPVLQINMIKEVLPAVKKIGIIYDPKSNADAIAQYTTLAEQFRLSIKAFPVDSQKDIPNALSQVNKFADALLGIIDSTVYTSRTTEFIIRYTVREHLPFIGISESYVKAGALCSLVLDSWDIGRQTAELAERILSGMSPTGLQTTTPEKFKIAVNLRTADIIGVAIPKKVQEKADIVYE